MADLEFSLPLPPEAGDRQAYGNTCRDRAWSAVGGLQPRSRLRWPTQDKVKVEINLYTDVEREHPTTYLAPAIDAIGGVLWHPKKTLPLIIVTQIVVDEKKDARLLVKVTRRKLVSEGAGKHYEW